MRLCIVGIIAAITGLASVHADSIRIGGQLHENVYIVQTSKFYVVHYPEEGRVDKVSRLRKDVRDVRVDEDESTRAVLLERFETRKAEKEQAIAQKVPEEFAALDGEEFQRRKQLADIALFELQLEHWKNLSDEGRGEVAAGIARYAEQNQVALATEWSSTQTSLGRLQSEVDLRKEGIENAKEDRREALRDLGRYEGRDIYRWEREGVKLRGQLGNPKAEADLDRRVGQRVREIKLKEEGEIEKEYQGRVKIHSENLAAAQDGVRVKERERIAIGNKAISASEKYGDMLSRVTALSDASKNHYVPTLKQQPITSWNDDKSRRTEPVVIESDLWSLVCEREAPPLSGDFSISVYEAGSKVPFTRISDADYLGMRARVFDGPGEYYFVIDQAKGGIPYEIEIRTMAE